MPLTGALLLLSFALAQELEEIPPDPGPTYAYRGIFGEGDFTAEQIAAFVRTRPTAMHEVRLDGWDDWRPATRESEIARRWLSRPVAEKLVGKKTLGAAPPASGEASETGGGAPPPSAAPEASAVPSPPPEAEREREPRAESGAAAVANPFVVVRGELWAGGTLDPASEAFSGGLTTRRVAAGLALRPLPELELGLLLDGQLAGEPGVEVREAALHARFAGSVEVGGHLGILRPHFGDMDRYEESRRYWVAGHSQELERTAGFLPSESLGIGAYLGQKAWRLDVEAADGEGTPTDLDAVDLRGRFSVVAGELFRVSASGGWRPESRTGLPAVVQGALSVEVGSDRAALLIHGLYGTATTEALGRPRVGAMASGRLGVPSVGALREFSVVAAGLGWDPSITGLPEGEDTPDATWQVRGGLNFDWAVPQVQAGAERTSLITGVGYLGTVPQDLALPITHQVGVEAAWRF